MTEYFDEDEQPSGTHFPRPGSSGPLGPGVGYSISEYIDAQRANQHRPLTPQQLLRAGWRLGLDGSAWYIVAPNGDRLSGDDIVWLTPEGEETFDPSQGRILCVSDIYKILTQ
ncbi:MAG: hypothetical protein RML57_10190 [Acidobacteriota bacterium]|nr:hypothetical protein [Acidobacteriota bacterium]